MPLYVWLLRWRCGGSPGGVAEGALAGAGCCAKSLDGAASIAAVAATLSRKPRRVSIFMVSPFCCLSSGNPVKPAARVANRRKFPSAKQLKTEFSGNLQDARVVGRGYLPEGAGVHTPAGILELRVIKRIE